MRHTEFWDRMDQVLGDDYARAWADSQSITELGSCTVREALDAGRAPRRCGPPYAATWDCPTRGGELGRVVHRHAVTKCCVEQVFA
ncbi:DUF3046 domain-containing protein [Nocardioides alcanivorans]|uniref:DUF3046 domain-containing protein n=1 Tax=Nocardioides alcanivorans TaxID=2897352 RepID=UPI001F27CFAF|nr:DUF3046 domain-containing protein [Nocardioides alcanivorans]